MSNPKLTQEDKRAKMTAIGVDFAVIESARKDVHTLEVQAAPKIGEIVKLAGAGPHKMPVPVPVMGADGKPVPGQMTTKDMIVTFRKDGDRWATSAVDADTIT
jgi:hypothetical protein